MRLDRAIDRFYALELARGRSRDYVHRFRTTLERLLRFLGGRGKDDLREVSLDDLRAYLRSLDRRRAATTVQLELVRLRRLFGFLHEAGLLLGNPTARLRRKHVTSPLRDGLTEDEIDALLAAPDTTTDLGLRDRAALELLYSSGLRTGELRRLELDDLDLADGLVTVRESKTARGRTVPVGRVALHWLRRYLDQARPRLVASARRPIAFFLGATGRPLTKNAIGTALRRHAVAAEIERHVSPHLLRHTFAAHLLKHGASIRHIQEMLGHRHLASTQVYTRLLPKELKRVHARCHPRDRNRP